MLLLPFPRESAAVLVLTFFADNMNIHHLLRVALVLFCSSLVPGISMAGSVHENMIQDVLQQTEDNTPVEEALKKLSVIDSSIDAESAHDAFVAAVNGNPDYPVPNELVARVLSKREFADSGELGYLAFEMRNFKNQRLNRFLIYKMFIQHPKLSAEDYVKIIQKLPNARGESDVGSKVSLIAEIYASEHYVNEDYKDIVSQHTQLFFADGNGVIQPELSTLYYEHLSGENESSLASTLSALYSDDLSVANPHELINKILALNNCGKDCIGKVLRLFNYKESLVIENPEQLLINIAQHANIDDYTLGEVADATWNAERQLGNLSLVLNAIENADNFGPTAKSKIEQALNNIPENKLTNGI